MEALIHGIVLAFGLILPLGVQNVFIFNQGATHKKFSNAIPAVITAGLRDTILISIAVAGVSIIILSFGWLHTFMYLVGFLFLLYMGFLMWKETSQLQKQTTIHTFYSKKTDFFLPHPFPY
ncbi:L-lysine exporter family protein LysE/ArgO OS=Ureibacillus acetophenoni OX=614649 GN=SAMN05877842_103260 PE=3 SV=1 [Ureibacillus acetophenoni]